MTPLPATPRSRRRPTAVLFDLDGTLLDTVRDLAACTNAALVELDAPPHPVEAYKRFVGAGVVALLQRALPEGRRDAETVQRGVASMRTYYAAHWRDFTLPYPGVVEMLAALVERRLPIAVLSNKPDDFVVLSAQHFFPDVPFAAVVGAREGVPNKPDPTSALALATEMEVSPADCWLVGDSGGDMVTAMNAGMVGVGAVWGFRGEDELRGAGAAILLSAPVELVARLDAS